MRIIMQENPKREKIPLHEFLGNMAFMVVCCSVIYGAIIRDCIKYQFKKNKESK